jgi:hypothetical protein
MAGDIKDIEQNIRIFLLSLRRTLDRPFRTKVYASEDDRERFMQSMLMVEEARIRFDTYTRYREEPTIAEWAAARNELLSFMDAFAHWHLTEPSVYDRLFILSPTSRGAVDNPESFWRMFMDRENRLTVSDALVLFRSYLESSNIELAPSQVALNFGDLKRIVPLQQVAPVQFEIVDGRIIISKRVPKTVEVDRDNIRSALEHICGSGEGLLKNLENSNCDRRLLESVKELHLQLTSENNIVKIGLTNMACGIMGAQFRAELPDAITGMLNAYNASISLYVAQFPE